MMNNLTFFTTPGEGEFCPQVLSFFLQRTSVNMGACVQIVLCRDGSRMYMFFSYNVDLEDALMP